MKAQEEETRLPAQTFIPSALSRSNHIRQKHEKYATHMQRERERVIEIQINPDNNLK